MQLVVANVIRTSQPTMVSRALVKVCDAFLLYIRKFIRMPETNAEREQSAVNFYQFAQFPRTIGARIDCTYVKVHLLGRNSVYSCFHFQY